MYENEVWKDIVGYEGLYQISNYGRVKSLYKDKFLKPLKATNGYFQINLRKNKYGKLFSISRLVALHFIPNINNKPEINHIDGNKKNNNYSNLEWVTHSENIQHAIKIGLKKTTLIIVFDLNDNFIIQYKSMNDAARELNLNSGSISKVCNGKCKKTGGFKFKYAK